MLGALAVLVLLGVAGVMLHGTFGRLSGAEFGAALRGLGPGALLPAVALTALSLLLMTGYDALALRHVGQRLEYRRYGWPPSPRRRWATAWGLRRRGRAVRARLYTRWGVPGGDVARVVALNLVTLVLGAAVLAGGGALAAPHAVAAALGVPVPAVLAVAGVLVGLVVAHLAFAAADRARSASAASSCTARRCRWRAGRSCCRRWSGWRWPRSCTSCCPRRAGRRSCPSPSPSPPPPSRVC